MVILDTDHLTLLQRSGTEAASIRRRLELLDPEEVATTIVSFEEQTRGWLAYAARARTLEEHIEAYSLLLAHLNDYCELEVLPFDRAAADKLLMLQDRRVRIGAMDMRIAAIAIANDATLLTRNLSDFGRVPGLHAEDWSV